MVSSLTCVCTICLIFLHMTTTFSAHLVHLGGLRVMLVARWLQIDLKMFGSRTRKNFVFSSGSPSGSAGQLGTHCGCHLVRFGDQLAHFGDQIRVFCTAICGYRNCLGLSIKRCHALLKVSSEKLSFVSTSPDHFGVLQCETLP